MHDQATDLRQLARQAAAPRSAVPVRGSKLVVVTGGKGGVGTSTIAVNLAVVLARRGRRTLLVDADPDAGDATTLCRLDNGPTIADVLWARRTVEEVLQPGPGGIRVLPGTWAAENLAECSAEAQQRLIEQLHAPAARFDFVVLDAGNGSGRLVRRFWQAADVVLLVTTPELASVMDAYASIKRLAAGNGSVPVHLLVNMAASADDAHDVGARLARACLRFLGLRLRGVEHVPSDSRTHAASNAGEPFVLAVPRSRSARQIHHLAETLGDPAAAPARFRPQPNGPRPDRYDSRRTEPYPTWLELAGDH